MTVLAGPLDRTLLPFRHLPWRSGVVALAGVAVPVCGVTAWLAVEDGHLLPAIVLTGLVLLVGGVMAVRVRNTRIVLTADGVRRWTPRRCDTRIDRSSVARAVVRAVHSADGRGVVRHLFLLDAADRTVFRMCDRWWTEAQISEVARHFEVPVETLPEPVHLLELRRSVPQQLQWDEQHPVLASLAVAAAGAAGCLAVGWLAVAAL